MDLRLTILGLKKKGMTQTAIANYVGCSQSTVSNVCRHSKEIPLDGGKIRALWRAGWDDYEIAKDLELDSGRRVRVEEIMDIKDRMGLKKEVRYERIH